ncbi:DUF368 domain-containing protein [Corynebacterium pygosceleis]|uniref:DUF368 domain-containing protein n=1 Tax=Corynebacterium pygosceleis TaxID=2800406 RepID=UPI001904DDDB|nr:DUF368 domain-containing protein [Corynebacterium pygosceleis]MCL0121085.1 DUF368 domain-containing protein [Corynebacterium pygosceleis]
MSQLSSTERTRPGVGEILLNVIRGGLIALAELVPGISGGTVALVVGVYERALDAGNDLITLARSVVTDRGNVRKNARAVDWGLILPVGIGMLVTVFALAGVMKSFVENQPQISRALFLGMVAASIVVPLQMVDRVDLRNRRVTAGALFAVAAVCTFFLTGFTAAENTSPALPVIFIAAAFAVCALVLPGVSGSFLLLALGLYGFVLGAVHDRNLTVIAVFVAGAGTGIILFIRLLGYLMHHHRTLTLVTMAGLMLGSLRALWPWQTEDAELLAPSGHVVLSVLFTVLGIGAVAATLWAESMTRRRERQIRAIRNLN